ncbi:uncharacterized protein LOC116176921 [Photinus pyralis]|uniref:uncharacterized protein LOC116176921 n=1 Tax=Photinus pyralis TaxID=7054 RepID=UPI0012670F03|nr:uncharacterized protein LOC116176921 [Photinus pyralis]
MSVAMAPVPPDEDQPDLSDLTAQQMIEAHNFVETHPTIKLIIKRHNTAIARLNDYTLKIDQLMKTCAKQAEVIDTLNRTVESSLAENNDTRKRKCKKPESPQEFPPLPTANRYNALATNADDEMVVDLAPQTRLPSPGPPNKNSITNICLKPQSKTTQNTSNKMPPICIKTETLDESYTSLIRKIKNNTGCQNFTLSHQNRYTKIFTQNLQDFASIKNFLEEGQVQFFTYTPREEINKNIVLKAAPNLDTNEIKDELRSAGVDALECKALKGKSPEEAY